MKKPPDSETARPIYDSSFTTYLFVLGPAAIMVIFSHEWLGRMSVEDKGDPSVMWIFRMMQVYDGLVAIGAVTAAILRTRRSPAASMLTAATSIFSILWAPLGTIAFIWWFGRVRLREREWNISADSSEVSPM